MAVFSPAGLVHGGRVGPQILGHQQPRLVVDNSHVPRNFDETSKLWVCPLDRVFNRPINPVIVFGVPNVSILLPKEDRSGWDRFAAFMFWRQASYVTDSKGRAQAGVFFELQGSNHEMRAALRTSLSALAGTRKASCAHSVALALHAAGFSCGSTSLRRIYRPSRLASVLWRNDLQYQGKPVELRIIQTHRAVSDHFVSVWKREINSAPRLARKLYAPAKHGTAPVFDPATENVEMSDALWYSNGPRADLGVSIPSRTGVNLGYLFGEQPEFTVRLPWPITDPDLPPTLKPFPGKLDRVTWLKKHILFSRPVVWFMQKHLSARTDWIQNIPLSALPGMLRRSPSQERDEAFVYNFTLSRSEVRLKRLLNNNGRDQKVIAWLLAKHVLQARYKDQALAGELWAYTGDDGEPVICLSGNSGTFKPDQDRVDAAARIVSKLFQARVDIIAR